MTNQNELQKDPNEMIYEAGGQKIKLSPSIVTQFVTKGNGNITHEEALNFMLLCKYAELNPFLNEAYLIKYGNQPAQMITAKEAILKRASRQPDYEGMTHGIITYTQDGKVNKREGQLVYPNEQLLGAWASVKRGAYKDPIYAEVAFQEYNTGKSTWKQMPANMIDKVAQNKALREAYPEDLGGMYTEGEPSFEGGEMVQVSEPDDKTKEILEGYRAENESEPANDEPKNDSATDKIIDGVFEETTNDEPVFKPVDPNPPAEEPETAVDAEKIDEGASTPEKEEQPLEATEATESNDELINWDNYTMDQIKRSLDKHGAKYPSDVRRDELVSIAEMVINGKAIQDELI